MPSQRVGEALSRRLGRRGTVLLMLGVLWVMQGIAVWVAPVSTEAGAEHLLHLQLPVWFRVSCWIGTGLVAILYAFKRVPPGADGVGFMALVIQPLQRTASYGYGFLVYLLSHATSPMWHFASAMLLALSITLLLVRRKVYGIAVGLAAIFCLVVGNLHPDIDALGYPRGLIGFTTWGTIAGLIIVVSGWADPRNRSLIRPS